MIITWVFIGLAYTWVVSDATREPTMTSMEPYYEMFDSQKACQKMAKSFVDSETEMFNQDDDGWNALPKCVEIMVPLETETDRADKAISNK